MSNIALFKSGSAIPEYLRAGTDTITREMAGGSGGKQISIKGGVWRMIVNGKEVAKNEDRAMSLVVVAAAKGVSRTFYAEKYEEGVNATPSCWSAEGITPDAEVTAPQAASCATCRQNIEGSGEGKSRACRYSKRLAVALEGDLSGNVYRMIVPAKSYFGRADGEKMGLQAYCSFLDSYGIPITGIVTEARFDTAEAVPVLKFRAVRPLTENEWGVAKAQGQSEEARSAVEFKMVPSSKPAAQPALPATFAATAPVVAPQDVDEPVKRSAKKPVEVAPAPNKDIADVLASWGTDDE